MIWWLSIWSAIVLAILTLGFTYLNTRLIRTLGLSGGRRKGARIVLALVLLVPMLLMVFSRSVEDWGRSLPWIAYIGLGFISLLITTLIVRDLLLLVLRIYTFLASTLSPRKQPPLQPARRAFLVRSSNFVVVGIAGTLAAYGMYQARRRPSIVNVVVPIQHLPEAFEGFRIVQISDLHAGLTVRRDWIESIARQVQELKPDLIAITGDLVDGSVKSLRNDVAPLELLTAPSGKFFITGNHEYYSGVEPWVEEVDRIGYTVLLNTHELIERNGSQIVLAGVTDYTGGNFLRSHLSDPGKAIAGAPDEAVKILLAHQPRSLYDALPHGFDLQISGHTHGGQFIPWNLLASIGQPYIAGLHKYENTWVYVSRGTGYWGPPVRIGARSEITLITLSRNA